MSTMPKLRWHQLSLRTLFVVTTFLCVGPGGYVAYEQHKARKGQAALSAIEKLGGRIEYTWDYGYEIPLRSAAIKFLLGDDRYLHAMILRSPYRGWEITDRDLEYIAALPNLEEVDIESQRVTDAGLAHLAGLARLRVVNLYGAQITDVGLASLTGLTEVRCLDLEYTPVTDKSLPHLCNLRNLVELNLSGTQITDVGLANLKTLPRLHSLFLDQTTVTESGAMLALRFRSLSYLVLDDTAVTEEGAQRLDQERGRVFISYRHSAGVESPLVRRGDDKPEVR